MPVGLCIAVSLSVTAIAVLWVNGTYAAREKDLRQWATTEVARSSDTKPTDVPCDPPIDLRTSDLCAQWKAADAADRGATYGLWTLIVSVVSMIVTAASVWFFWLSLKATRETLNATREQQRAEFRGYLRIDIGSIVVPFGAVEWKMELLATNYGRTPIDILEGEVSYEVFDGAHGFHNAYGVWPDTVHPGPARRLNIDKEYRSDVDWRAVAKAQGVGSISIHIVYKDVFEDNYSCHEEFLFDPVVEDDGSVRFQIR